VWGTERSHREPSGLSVRGPTTLRGRLALSALATAAVAVLALTALFALLLERRLDAEATNVLRSRAETVAATVAVRDDGSLQVTDTDQDAALDTGIWIYQGRTAIERPAGVAVLQQTADALAGTTGRSVRRDKKPATQFLSVAISSEGQQVGTVVAALSLDPYRRSSRATLVGALGLGLVLVVVVYLVARRVAARALSPVAAMTHQASAWSASDTSLRFGTDHRPGELEELAATLDGLLDRLSAVLRREQQLSAEISHELRTPLAGITAEIELFATRPRSHAEAGRAMAQVGESARRMERILDTLLAAARAEAPSASGRCDAVAVARSLGVPVEVSGDVPFVGVADEVVERVLGPLLDNASRYADSTRVRVSADSHWVLLEVLDDGPGIPAGSEEAVFDAGLRLDPTDGHDGAGLGLPLSRRLARAAGGDLTCSSGPGGRFLVRFPRA
jgi:signal transduction histidine kinase